MSVSIHSKSWGIKALPGVGSCFSWGIRGILAFGGLEAALSEVRDCPGAQRGSAHMDFSLKEAGLS